MRKNTSVKAKQKSDKANILKELISHSFNNSFKSKRKSSQVMRKKGGWTLSLNNDGMTTNKLLLESRNPTDHSSTLDFLDT
jgi:hypothetical protein